jgi:hypothetical protein
MEPHELKAHHLAIPAQPIEKLPLCRQDLQFNDFDPSAEGWADQRCCGQPLTG